MRRIRVLLFTTMLTAVAASPALADATVFIGNAFNPANRPAKGVAIGVGLLVIGFEFEYAEANEALEDGAPSLRTGMGNVLLQTPVPIAGMQFYGTTGGGVYREEFGTRHETYFGINTGGGVKASLAGPIRARIDYRVFTLGGEPLHSVVHRVYAGLNLAF